ncbi:MAG: hypothetical protein ACTHJR_06170 [Sphingomonas sp.]|uniref:hypothetical protein n=1 Tax=Sphingomonas sp. TaxID=28214 RepID=UPI003F7DF9EC
MRLSPSLMIAIAALGSATCASAQETPAPAFTEAAKAQFGPSAPTADIAYSNGAVTSDDVIMLVDQCMKLAGRAPGYWPTLKADGWLLESGRDIPADTGWEGVFIKPGRRGKLVEHISQGDIVHCEARGEPGSATLRPQIQDAVVAHYRAVAAAEFKGDSGFIENIRAADPKLLRGLYVSSQNAVFGINPDLKSTSVSISIFAAPPAPADNGPDLQPAPQAAIVAGAKACLGTTVDPASQAARFAGWAPATPEQRKGMNTDSDANAVTRDNVLVAYKTGKDGGCVVMAKGDAAFDPATLYPLLSAALGATVPPPAADAKPAPVALPNGEMIIPVVTPKTATAAPTIILVIANSAGKFAKKGN